MKSVRQFDRFVDMALNMAISNFGDLNIKGQTGVKMSGSGGHMGSFGCMRSKRHIGSNRPQRVIFGQISVEIERRLGGQS